jgi:hypothetical protein
VQVAAFCQQRSTDDYRIEHAVRGSSITIVERRPPWNPDVGTEWSTVKVAQLRYDDMNRRWRPMSAGSDHRWHLYDVAGSASAVVPLLDAFEHDRTGIF